jgi:hypothetical protein
MNKIILSIPIIFSLTMHAFSMEKENIKYHDQSIYLGWELVEYVDNPQAPIDEEESLELKARAAANTAATLLAGTGMTIYNFGVGVVEHTIARTAQRFERGAQAGALLTGLVYGQGLALDHAYETEKARLKNERNG